MYHINAESKSVTNITQIAVFFAFFLCWFQVCLSNLKRFPRLAQSIPVHLHPNAVVALISTFHAIISTLLSALILYYDKDLGEHKLIYSSFMISFTLNFSMGYLLFDLFIMSIHRAQFEFQFVIHHFVSIVAFYCCSTHGVFPYIALARLTSEGSTPFLNVRWLLLTMNKKNSKWYTYNGLLLLIAFTCVRIVTIVPIWYIFFTTMNTPEFHSIELKHKFVCVFSSSPLDVLNLFWWSKMIRMVRKSFFSSSSSSNSSKRQMLVIKQKQQDMLSEETASSAEPKTSSDETDGGYTKCADE